MTVEISLRIEEQISEMGDAIGLRPGFYAKLLKEPLDWAFLVQLHVIVEAALAQRLVEALQEDKAFDHVSRLPLDGKTGKIQLALSLGIVDSSGADALRALTACRNRFAHRIANIGATLEKFGDSLDDGTKLDLLRKMGTLRPENEHAEHDAGFPDFGAKLRRRLWLSTAISLAQTAAALTHARLLALQRELERI